MEILDYSNLTGEYLNNLVTNYITNYDNLVNTIIEKIPDDQLCWDNLIQVILDFDDANLELSKLNMKDFYVDEEIRNICSDLDTQISKFNIDQSMRKDYFNKFSYYYKNIFPEESKKLNIEQIKYINDLEENYKNLGMYLDDNKYEKVKCIKKEIEELSDEFNNNLNNENSVFYFNKEELVGLPDKYFEDRVFENNKFMVTLKYPDYNPLMEYCKNRDIRKKMCIAYNSRCINENSILAKKIFSLRNELANIFDYDKFSDYVLTDKMAKNTDSVMKFLIDIKNKINKQKDIDIENLKKIALEDNIDEIQLYDIAYYSRIYKQRVLNISKEDIKIYFNLEKVTQGMFNIYSKLLNYEFVRNNNYNNTLWHNTVELYDVFENNNLIGHFYLDLFPRDGKYSHAACFDIINKSKNNKPIAFIACNFTKNDNLDFDEVETYFHEFGHVMHHLSAKSTISPMSSFSCESDFVETPSQLFEEWCYVPETLKMMANDNISDYIIEKIIQSRNLLQGYHYARQLLFGFFDMDIHGNNYNKDPAEHYNKLFNEIIGLKSLENTNNIASFGHLFGGYESGYYGYLWSLVYAKDLFTRFQNNELNSEIGKELKEKVLCWGGIRDSVTSMIDFLGREPNSDYFISTL